jgi:hypothetical protein
VVDLTHTSTEAFTFDGVPASRIWAVRRRVGYQLWKLTILSIRAMARS